MVTVKDIAKAAGVSHPAVSAVLNGRAKKARIGQATSKRILEVADELGYKPNLMARGLRTGKTFSIGILLPAPYNNFFASLISQLEKELSLTPYSGIFAFWSSEQEMKRATQTILERQVDGIITVEPDILPNTLDIPLVSLFSEDKQKKYDIIKLDKMHMFDLVVKYLYDLGHRRIIKPDCIATATHANSLFRNALKQYGLSDQWIISALPSFLKCEDLTEPCEKLVDRIFSEKERPTAVVMPNDNSAIAFIAAAWRKGIKVPDDISVVGADNISIAMNMIPSLTTFDFEDKKNIAQSLLEILMNRIDNAKLPRQEIKIKPKLIIRESCSNII